MKKILALLLSLVLTLATISNTCKHTHDEFCGYDQNTQTGCTHECDDDCFEIDPHLGLGPGDDHN